MRHQLFFSDLVVLSVAMQSKEIGITHASAVALGNQWLQTHRVPPNYSQPISKSKRQWKETVGFLAAVGLISYIGPRQGYRVTKKGSALLEKQGANWRRWFISAPVQGQNVLLEKAVFASDFREVL